MASFKKYADDFKTRWFGRDEASLQDIAAEYWSIVDKGDKHVGVCYGSGVYRFFLVCFCCACEPRRIFSVDMARWIRVNGVMVPAFKPSCVSRTWPI